MLIATAGHVDHGKTSLVQALTGVDTDRLAEERKRGLTIDLGFAYLPVSTAAGDLQVGFVDVPGHERFINNMLAGVAGIDHALLVVAADDGVMPQTREHLQVMALLGVPAVTPVLNKCDRVSAERCQDVQDQLSQLLADTGMQVHPCHLTSATTGAGIDALLAHIKALAASHQLRQHPGAFRISIDRSFTLAGAGLVVTGTVHSGVVRTGDQLLHQPSGSSVRVRSLRVHDRSADQASTGQRCALNLTGLDRAKLSRGHWLLAADRPETSRRLHLLVTCLAGNNKALRPQTPVTVHLAATRVHGRLSALTDVTLAPGTTAFAELLLDEPLPARWGDHLVLRDDGGEQNLAGARVLDALPPPKGRRGDAHLAWLQALADLSNPSADSLPTLLAAAPNGISLARLAGNLNLDASQTQACVAAAARVDLGQDQLLLDPGRWQSLRQGVLAAVTAWHQQSPQTAGINEQQLLTLRRNDAPNQILRAAVTSLVSDSSLKRSGALFHLPDHQPRLHGADDQLWQSIRKQLQAAGMPPPVVHDLAKTMNKPAKTLQEFLERISHQGLVVKVVANRFFLPQDVTTLADQAAALSQQMADGEFTAREYRDAAGIGRNLAIEVLEYFDVKGLTRRLGDRRRVVKPVAAVFGG